MKHFHITWFDNIEDHYSKGETFEGIDPLEALDKFKDKYPNAIFLSCVSAEVLNLKKGGQPISQNNP
jgi:hypothetical protein